MIQNHLKSLKNVKLCKKQGENVNFKGVCNNVQKNVHEIYCNFIANIYNRNCYNMD